MKKILLIAIFGMFFLSLASASIANIGTVQQNDCIKLKQTCPDCSYNNITSIDYPNRTTEALYLEVSMTKDGTEYNYTFCSTSALGEYIVNGKGDIGGVSTTWNYVFDVTTTGGTSNIIIPIFLLIAAMVLFGTATAMKNPPFGFFAGILFIMVGMYIMIYGFGDIADLYTQALALITLGFGMITVVIAGYSWLDEYEET